MPAARLLCLCSLIAVTAPFTTHVAASHAVRRWSSVQPRAAAYDADDEADLNDACRVDERCIYFVTGNAMKEKEVNMILAAEDLGAFRVQHVDISLPELQGDPLEIASHKCMLAAEEVQASVIVEDTSLCFNALNGMPGPYIKWFVEAVGNDGLYDMLRSAEDKSAFCQCTLAFSAGPGAEPLLFVGRTDGQIVEPLGKGGFGWDSIFVPDGFDVPFGAMELGTKNTISHRSRALSEFVAYCKGHDKEITKLMSRFEPLD